MKAIIPQTRIAHLLRFTRSWIRLHQPAILSTTLKTLLYVTVCWLCTLHSMANGVVISNLTFINQNTSAGSNNAANYTIIKFDLAWNNSWRVSSGPSNWDAVWVFFKYKVSGGAWNHAALAQTNSSAPAGAVINIGLLNPLAAFNATSNPGVGAFVYRSSNGAGSNNFTNMEIRWNYGINGVGDSAAVDFMAYAVEMVYVPQDSFYLGSGGSETSAFYQYPTTTQPFQITSDTASIVVGTTNGNLYYASSADAGDRLGPVPSGFPKGYHSFYCMKYEITQKQYVDFLNSLTRTQQNARTATNVGVGITAVTNRYVMTNTSTVNFRNGIRCDSLIHTSNPIVFYCDLNGNGIANEADDGAAIAANYISYADFAAFLDWSGLRPMSELEYEKACRGDQFPVANEYAWGTNTATSATNIINQGTVSEGTSTANANAVYGNNANVQGPLRVGSFATSTSSKVQAGASYYGILDMNGNLAERAVTIGNSTGRSYTGNHGDGSIDMNGNADALLWPSPADAIGNGFRGGGFTLGISGIRTSDRLQAAYIYTPRFTNRGGRGVRSSN